MSIRTKILAFVSLLLGTSVAVIAYVCWSILLNYQDRNTRELFASTEYAVNLQFNSLSQKLKNEASLVAELPILSAVVENGDPATIKDSATVYRDQLNLHIMDLYDADGQLLTSLTSRPTEAGKHSLPTEILAKVMAGSVITHTELREGMTAVLGIAPIGTKGDPSGVLVVGTYLDETFAAQVKKMTNSDLTFATVDQRVMASSLAADRHGSVIEKMTEILRSSPNLLFSKDYIYSAKPIYGHSGQMVAHSIVQFSLASYNAILYEIRDKIILYGIAILIISLILAIFVAQHIAKPIFALKEITGSIIESFDLSKRAAVDGAVEIVSLATAFNRLLDEIEASQLKLEEYNRNLETKVEERTTQVRKEKDKIQRIFDNIELGICTINCNFSLEDEFSRFLPIMFSRKAEQVAGQNVLNFIFDHGNISGDDLDLMKNSLNSILGESRLAWELNSQNLVTEVEVEVSPSVKRAFMIDWSPIFDSGGLTSQLMLTIKDVTNQRLLEQTIYEEKGRKDKMMFILSELVPNDQLMLNSFFRDCEERMVSLETQLMGLLDSAQLFANLHTIKGAARVLALSKIKEIAHEAETIVDEKRKGRELNLSELSGKIQGLVQEIVDYRSVYDDVFGGQDHVGSVSGEGFLCLHTVVGQHLGVMCKSLGQAKQAFDLIRVSDAVVLWERHEFNKIASLIIHSLNNSIDHGYVLPAQQAKGGERLGKVSIEILAERRGDRVAIEIMDRGAGINVAKVRQKVRERYQVATEEIDDSKVLSYLFEDGFSTAEEVTESSGRGSGLSAIKAITLQLGGTVEISNNQQGSPGTKVTILLPVEKVVHMSAQ